MPSSTSSHHALVRAIALFFGASFFAYLFAVTVHEFGHYLASDFQGVPDVRIVLHPFDLSYGIYGGDLSQALGTPLRRAFNGASGPLLNVLLGGIVGLLLWRKRSSSWLPVLMLGPVALIQEGANMIGGIIDYPNISSDWVDVMLEGVPPIVIGVLAVVLLAAGSVWMLLLLPLAGIRADDASWRKLLILLAGIPMFHLSAVIYLTVVGSSPTPAGWALQNRLVALGASIILMLVLTTLYKPLFLLLDRISHTSPAQLSWSDTVPAVSLGVAVFVHQLMFFN